MKLGSGELDIAIVAGAEAEVLFEARYVGSVQFAWMASGSLQLPRKRWTQRDLVEMPLIYRGEESATRRLMSQWLGSEVSHGLHSVCNSMAGIASPTAAGVGFGFLPLEYHADRIVAGSLQKLETSPDSPRLPFSIAYASQQNTSVLQLLVEYAVQESSFEFE